MIHRVMLCYGIFKIKYKHTYGECFEQFFIKEHVKSLNVVCEPCHGESCLRHCIA